MVLSDLAHLVSRWLNIGLVLKFGLLMKHTQKKNLASFSHLDITVHSYSGCTVLHPTHTLVH